MCGPTQLGKRDEWYQGPNRRGTRTKMSPCIEKKGTVVHFSINCLCQKGKEGWGEEYDVQGGSRLWCVLLHLRHRTQMDPLKLQGAALRSAMRLADGRVRQWRARLLEVPLSRRALLPWPHPLV